MRENNLVERVESEASGGEVGGLGRYALVVAAGLTGAVVAASLTGWSLFDPVALGALVGGALAAGGATYSVLWLLGNVGEEVRFYEDGLVVVSFDVLGRESGALAVRYDEIDLVVRAELTHERPRTTVSYVLVRSESPPVALAEMADPQAVERAFSEHVADPEDLARHVEDDYGKKRSVESDRAFWKTWPGDEPLPSSPVVDRSALPAVIVEIIADEDLPSLSAASDLGGVHPESSMPPEAGVGFLTD